jgi:hypothetical protein
MQTAGYPLHPSFEGRGRKGEGDIRKLPLTLSKEAMF